MSRSRRHSVIIRVRFNYEISNFSREVEITDFRVLGREELDENGDFLERTFIAHYIVDLVGH